MSKKKAKAVPNWTPLEVEAAIANIARLQAELAAIKSEAGAELAKLSERLAAAVVGPEATLNNLVESVLDWADANRAEICAEGTKTAKFAAGEISWRFAPAAVKAPSKPEKLKAIVKALLKGRLKRFVRVKLELDKEAILKEPEKIKGIAGLSVKQDELISLKPYQPSTEPVELSRKAS